MEALTSSLRDAFRALRRTPGTTISAVVILSLGLGAATAVFSVARHVLLNPLPYPQPRELALVWSALESSGYERAPISGPELHDLSERVEAFDRIGAIWSTQGALVDEAGPESLRLGLVTAGFLDVLGVEPALGRSFLDSEEGETEQGPVLLSDGLWQRRFGADPSVLGRTVRIDGGWGFGGGRFTVVGVLPPDFRLVFPADASIPAVPDALIPFAWELAGDSRGTYYLRAVARLAPGAGLEQAREEVVAAGRAITSEHAVYAGQGRSFDLVSLHDDAVAGSRPALLALLAGVGLVLVLVCADVAGLQLVRVAERGQEIRVRRALGSSAGRIAGRILAESLLLSCLGGLVGLLLADWILELVVARLLPSDSVLFAGVGLESAVFFMALGTAVVCGSIIGLVPLREAFRARLTPGRERLGSTSAARWRQGLVVAQVAIGILVLAGVGLSVESFRRLRAVDPGFESEGTLTARLNLPRDRYGSPQALAALAAGLESGLSSLPGVSAAGAINQLPLDEVPNWSTGYGFRGAPPEAAYEADARVVSAGYFAAAGVRVLEGRGFREGDGTASRPVVVVDRQLAEGAWPGRSAVGRELRIRVFDGRSFALGWAEVIGVVEHVRHHGLREEGREQLYVPFAQGARNQMSIVVRTEGDPMRWAEGVQRVLAELDPELAVAGFEPLGEAVSGALGVPRLTAVVALGYGSLALVLAAVGLYGVVAGAVTRRVPEIGLRIALGARPADVVRMVVARGLRLTLLGSAIGLALAAVGSRGLAAMLYEVDALDPVILTGAPALLVAVGLVAAWIPARRASRLSPTRALRSE